MKLKSLRDEPDHKRYLSASESTFGRGWKLTDGVYLNNNMSASGIAAVLQGLFKAYDLDETDFTVVLHEDDEGGKAANDLEDLTLDAIGL